MKPGDLVRFSNRHGLPVRPAGDCRDEWKIGILIGIEFSGMGGYKVAVLCSRGLIRLRPREVQKFGKRYLETNRKKK